MFGTRWYLHTLMVLTLCLLALPAAAQTFKVQCPQKTTMHPNGDAVDAAHPGLIRCQQISGGDGFATMGDGTQTYLFAFGPLSGLAAIASGQPGTDFPSDFNTVYPGPLRLMPGDPATTDDPSGAGGSSIKLSAFTYNGA